MTEMEGKAKSETSDERFWSDFNKALNNVPFNVPGPCNVLKSVKIDQQLMERIVDLFFEMAISKPDHIFSYGLVCKKLSDRYNSSTVNFRESIIARCLSELKNCSRNEKLRVTKGKEIEKCTDTEKKKELRALHEKEGRSLRLRPIGTISLMKELWRRRMLKKKIMHLCINHLLNHRHEENLEFLYKLLMEIGGKLEFNGDLEEYFMLIQLRIKDQGPEKISSRVREMLQELIALRANKWASDDSVSKADLAEWAEIKKKLKKKIHPHEKALYEEVRCILDNVDSKNIDTVVSKIKSLPIELKWLQEVLLEKVFNKIDFTIPCVLLCQKLSSMEVPGTVVKSESWKDFEKMFAFDCAHEFEHYLEEAKDLKRKPFGDIPELLKSNAYARLIGELFCENLISHATVEGYIKSMLEYKTEDNLIRLCGLLDSIQEKLVYFDNLTNYVDDLQQIVDEKASGRYCNQSYELLEETLEWMDLLLLTPEQMFMSTMKMFHEMR